jgi:2,3-bisphosphoglycerate-dependent phosphoglycerate mutase
MKETWPRMKPSFSISRPRVRLIPILIAALCAALLVHSAVPRGEAAQGEFKVTTVFLIRHAEKADAPPQDPPLSESGKARSQELARMLGGAGIKAIYTSQYLRTKQTIEPLASQLGLTPTAITLKVKQSNPREVSEQSIAEIVNKIYERSGDAVLIVGHSNTIPEVIKMLGGDIVPTIAEKKFDDLFVVTVYGKGKAKVVQMKYGSPN